MEHEQMLDRGQVVVQSLSCVQLFVTPWTAARQASLSFTIFQSLFKQTYGYEPRRAGPSKTDGS